MSETKDYYWVLGLTRDATEPEIRKAYKDLALKLHPDKNENPKAEEKFKEVLEAYNSLSNPQRKLKLDRDLAAAEAQAKEAMAARAREMWQQTSAQAKEVTASRAREMWQHQVWFAQHQGFATGQPHSFHWQQGWAAGQQSWNGGAHNTWATLQQGWTAQQQDWATGQQTFSAGQQGWTAQQDWATGHQVWTTGQQSFDAGQEAWAHMQQARAAMMRSSLSDIWHAMAARNQASWMHAPPVAGMKEETAGMLAAMQAETARQQTKTTPGADRDC